VHAKLCSAVLILIAVTLAPPATPQADPDLASQMQMEVVDTTLLEYSPTKLVLGLTLSITSKRDLTVEQIVLSGLRLNGLPLYAAPIKQRLQLHSGEKMLLHDPLPVTVYFRDLDTVAPLAKAIATGHTTVDGTAYTTVRVSPLAAMLLFSNHVEVAINLHEDLLPLTIPGGPVVKNASLVALQAADMALQTLSAKVSSGKDWAFSFRKDAMKQYAPHLMLACARFELRDHQGQTTQVQWYGVALATAPDLLLVPREAIEPWKFDSDMADAIQSKKLSLNSSSYDLWLWPASAPLMKNNEFNPDTALRLSRKQFSVVRMPDRDERKIRALEDSGKTRKISVEKRDSSSDLALLRIDGPSRNFDAVRGAQDSQASQWESVVLFRFRGARNSTADPELIVMPAKRDGNRIALGELVDSSTFGSPIVAPEGVIGIVQDENSGVAWSEAARVLKLDKR